MEILLRFLLCGYLFQTAFVNNLKGAMRISFLAEKLSYTQTQTKPEHIGMRKWDKWDSINYVGIIEKAKTSYI